MIEDVSHLPPVWCTLSCEYLREFSKKFETALMDFGGNWFMKKPEVENLVTLSV